MKPSTTETGKADRKFVQRLQALIRPGRKKLHRLSASVTGEEDWEVDEPQIRMSRAFAVMLVLHLVAVGGLFAFHVFGKDDREAELNATRTAHQNSLPPPAAPVMSTAPVPAAPTSPASAPRAEIVSDESASGPASQKHIFKAGETKMLIAAKFGVTVRELEDANRDLEFKTGEILTIPQHQRVIGAMADRSEPANPPLALIVATPSEDVGHRDFALKKGAEDPYAPVEPAELAALTPEGTSVRTKTVKAEAETTVVRAGAEAADSEEAEVRPASAPAPKVKKTTPPPVAAAPAKPKPVATGSRTHVVGKGDTVYNVAKRYGLSPNEILRANGISDPSRLQMGQVLKITVRR
jgi:LysM repeat protein